MPEHATVTTDEALLSSWLNFPDEEAPSATDNARILYPTEKGAAHEHRGRPTDDVRAGAEDGSHHVVSYEWVQAGEVRRVAGRVTTQPMLLMESRRAQPWASCVLEQGVVGMGSSAMCESVVKLRAEESVEWVDAVAAQTAQHPSEWAVNVMPRLVEQRQRPVALSDMAQPVQHQAEWTVQHQLTTLVAQQHSEAVWARARAAQLPPPQAARVVQEHMAQLAQQYAKSAQAQAQAAMVLPPPHAVRAAQAAQVAAQVAMAALPASSLLHGRTVHTAHAEPRLAKTRQAYLL